LQQAHLGDFVERLSEDLATVRDADVDIEFGVFDFRNSCGYGAPISPRDAMGFDQSGLLVRFGGHFFFVSDSSPSSLVQTIGEVQDDVIGATRREWPVVMDREGKAIPLFAATNPDGELFWEARDGLEVALGRLGGLERRE